MKTLARARLLLALCFLLLLVFFAHHLMSLGRKLDASGILTGLEASGELRALRAWEVSLFRCPRGPARILECTPRGDPFPLSLPSPGGIGEKLKEAAAADPEEPPNAALLRYVFDGGEKTWLGDKRIVTFVLPRSVQNRARIEAGGQVWETTGVGVSVQAPMPASDLIEAGELRAELYFTGLPWFGPADFPPALAKNESVDTYVSLPLRSLFASELPDLLLMGFPILLVALALVLDHSTLFLSLSLYGAARAARAFLGTLIASGETNAPAAAYAYLALDGLVAATLLQFILLFCGARKRFDTVTATLALLGPALFLALGAVKGTPFLFLKSSDLWSDVLACTLALPVVLYAAVVPPGAAGTQRNSDHEAIRPRALIVAAALAAHLWGATMDLASLSTGGTRGPLAVAHHVLLPVLIVATLFSVGSVTKRMTQYAALMKGRLEALLQGTRELATAHGSPQAFAGALRCASEQIPALRPARFEIHLPRKDERPEDATGESTPDTQAVLRYVLEGTKARAGEQPLFEGFDDTEKGGGGREVRREGTRISFPLWHGEAWKGNVAILGLLFPLDAEDEEYLSTLFAGLAITLENLATVEALERADRLKDEFLANTSHELRTPLTGIIGISEGLLARPLASQDMRQATRSLSIISSSARRLANLVSDILDFSRLRENSIELQRRPVSLSASVEMAVALCGPLVGSKAVRLSTEIPEDLPPVLADENRLQQILCNLVGNAIKFTEKGSVRVLARVEGHRVQVDIQDTGIGIAKGAQQDIFKSFVQGAGSIAREYGGTGLGLTVTKRLVELHRGTLTVESEIGAGSTFTFTLPVSPQPVENLRGEDVALLLQRVMENPVEFPIARETLAQGPTTLQSGMPNFLRGTRILVVDDEAVNREVLKMQLELEGCEVLLAALGDEALEILTREKVDCVLLDLMLPRRNGFDVCRTIRLRHDRGVLPVILLTAKNQVSDLVTAFECGANDFLSKPFSRKELLARLENHLRLAKTHIAYARFVPNDLLALLGKEHITDVVLGDQALRAMGVLFLDIRGFTRLAESLSAKETFDFLNAYFDTINPVVTRHRGFIDKYIGDAVMALFPVDPGDALRAGVDLLAQVRAFNQRNEGRGLPAVRIGLGAHGGTLMLGTIGHAERMEGTVISEVVNLASRLEGMSKAFGASLVTTRALVDGLESHAAPTLAWRPMGRVRAKGSSRTVDVVEVISGDEPTLREAKEASRPALERAHALFGKREFAAAEAIYTDIAARTQEDGLAAFFARECARLAMVGVPEEWDGSLSLQEK